MLSLGAELAARCRINCCQKAMRSSHVCPGDFLEHMECHVCHEYQSRARHRFLHSLMMMGLICPARQMTCSSVVADVADFGLASTITLRRDGVFQIRGGVKVLQQP